MCQIKSVFLKVVFSGTGLGLGLVVGSSPTVDNTLGSIGFNFWGHGSDGPVLVLCIKFS